MGIPKFFRYISERYPLISQLVQENHIPEFDNFYLDFNGIIHNCSHPNDGDAHYRVTEEQIFTTIFQYVDLLFGKIKPKKLFFMAVDGVAPRAKMNQQRGRRFRTAKEAKEVREQAERKGEKLPDEKAFDSNCITPGTPFMARLSEQLRYFVNKKITEDSNWQGVEVILSGHEVPGEGEHKIMEYIRLSKAQLGYNPNTRHCLYGLDADLIMLGLLSHDPHFCLLREEVKFGPASRKKNTNSHATNFYLLHLCLLREYLDLEFKSIAPDLPFEYNLEQIIDDFVLLAVFIGNDFLPHLPDLHIQDNGLPLLFGIYKEVLPKAGGYINKSGVISTGALQMVLDRLAENETEVFYKETGDSNWMQSKRKQAPEAGKSIQGLTKAQKSIFQAVKKAVLGHRNGKECSLSFLNNFSARDRHFITELASDLNLQLAWDAYDESGENVVVLGFPSKSPVTESDAEAEGDGGGYVNISDDEDLAESSAAVDRVLSKYARLKIIDGDEEGDFDEREEKRLEAKVHEWKRHCYQDKLEISYDDKEALNTLIHRWAEGLQWVMYYYYSGVASWSWFYDYHYAPRVSDLKGVDNMEFRFDLGEPFHPFQQLMGVLPEASKELIPMAYQDLMYDSNSPILDFYPQTFETDLNGKKNEWEAIVKIPFLDQERLLKAMASRDHRLTPEEVRRNEFGASTRFHYDSTQATVYPSSLPGFFAAIHRCTCRMESFNLPTLDGLHLVKGLCDGAVLGTEALAGFPSLHTLPHTGRLKHHRVNVFQSESRHQSMVIEIDNDQTGKTSMGMARAMIGNKIFIGWPFLQEGLVVAVSDEFSRYEEQGIDPGGHKRIVSISHTPLTLSTRKRNAQKNEELYSRRYAVVIGRVKFALHVRPLKGLKRLDTGALVKDYEGADKEVEQVAQLAVPDVTSEDTRYLEQDALPLQEEFPLGSRVIFMGEHAYGVAAQVVEANEKALSVILAFFPSETSEPDKFAKIVHSGSPGNYFQSYDVSRMVGLSGLALAKITSSLIIMTGDGQKANIGLSLKYEARGLKVMNYSRKNRNVWEFSYHAIELIREYLAKFPVLRQVLNSSKDDIPQSSDAFFEESNPDQKVNEIKTWLKSKGVHNFEQVALNTDSLSKEIIVEIEKLADSLNATKSTGSFKKAKVQGIPRQAILKPSHAVYRLRDQRFSLGDRVLMAQDSGSVPLCARGVVVGLSNDLIDVIWDVQFISGTTLNGRCSEYRGSSVPQNSCLNLTDQQFCASTKPKTQPVPILAPPMQRTPGLRRTQPQRVRRSSREIKPTHIMKNPNRSQFQSGQGHGNPGSSTFAPSAIQDEHSQGSYGATLKAPAPPAPVVSHAESLRNTIINQGPTTQSRPQSGRGSQRLNRVNRGGLSAGAPVSHADSLRNSISNQATSTQTSQSGRGGHRFNPIGRGGSVLPARGLNSVGRGKFGSKRKAGEGSGS